MSICKLIYFRYIPLTQKIYTDLYMYPAEQAGFEVEYWDLSAIFFKENHQQEDSSHLTTTYKFNSYKELEEAIAKQDKSCTLFISIVTYENRVVRLYRLLTKYNCMLGVFGRNMFPLPDNANRSIIRRLMRVTPKKALQYIKNKSTLRLKPKGRIKGYDIMFLAGNNGWRGFGMTNESEVAKAHVVEINSDDYDNYLKNRASPRVVEGDYILFLDEYLPLHPDMALFGNKSISCSDYYIELNRFFDRIEQQFSMPVVVAAHPKALRYKEEDFFNGRQIYFGKTAELSHYAHFVLAHDSTAINYPVSFGVRLHLITTRNIERDDNDTHRHTIMFANYLKCNWQYMDEDSIDVVDKIDSTAYNKYKHDFQCSIATENTLSEDIFISNLKKL